LRLHLLLRSKHRRWRCQQFRQISS